MMVLTSDWHFVIYDRHLVFFLDWYSDVGPVASSSPKGRYRYLHNFKFLTFNYVKISVADPAPAPDPAP